MGSATYSIYMKRNIYKVSTLVVFFLFAAGITWTGEFIVLGLFKSYEYKTGLFTDPWAENILGHLILNTTIYPAAAVVTGGYSLRYRGIALVTALFILAEYLFLKLGLYEHHWWRFYMSTINIVVFLLISRSWFFKINQKPYGLTRALTFYFVALIIIHTPVPILLFLGKQYYQIGFINNWAGNFYLSNLIIAYFYHLFESSLLVLFVCVLKKWYWNIMPFIISFVIQSIFVKANILIIDDEWKLVYTVIIYEIFIALFILLEKYTLTPNFNKLEKSD
jgi:hypothetical protein